MKKYTILEDYDDNVMMVPTKDIYKVVNLQHDLDYTYILTPDGELEPAYGYYPTKYFEGSDSPRLVIKKEDNDNHSLNADGEILTIQDPTDPWNEDAKIDVIDVTESWMLWASGEAVDVQHGINTTQIFFNEDDSYGWKSVDEVDAEDHIEHMQDYPNQEFTRIYECSNGRKIRETFPFFADEHMNTYEYVD